MIFRLFILSILLIPLQLNAQYQNIKVNSSGNDPEEVSIAVNPVNPANLTIGANIFYCYSSTNSGLTWSQKNLTSSLFGVWGDPCLIYDAIGNLFYSHLSNTPSPGYWVDRIVVQKSSDNGATFNQGVGIGFNNPREQDKEWLSVDLQYNRNYLYTSWTEFDSYGSTSSADSSRILFSRSTDHGDTWTNPLRLSEKGGDCIDSSNTVEGAVPAVGPNGEIYDSWAGPLGIVFTKSTDQGLSFEPNQVIIPIPGGWDFNVPGIYRCNGLPITACDTSHASTRGNIYICWGDQRNGSDNSDVFLIKSTNGGNTWNSVKKVNNDNTARHQFFPWMTIDQTTGHLFFVFYDRRSTIGNATDVYCAESVDGGDSFNNFKISQSSFTPTSTVFFGDYTGIAAFNRKVYPAWMRLDNGILSVWTAPFTDTASVTPVELTQFTSSINNKIVELSWHTATEINNYGFELERKFEDNSAWINIGFIKGKGTSTSANSYSFKDSPSKAGTYKYRLKQIDLNGRNNYSNEIEVVFSNVFSFSLNQNYPNPFNPSTIISYQLSSGGLVTIKVYDVLGNEITTLVNEIKQSGVHEINFDASELSSGIYMYRMTVNNFTQIRKMILLK
ncbi:MAG: T9SS type A sorting domain-containing protein [Ignavibacteriaceae bacterium]|nr:T9SS type A sorting domain-containing protein [Ignavibacteriaceae bacterium]